MRKWSKTVAVGFLVVSLVLAASYAARRDPIFIIPGKQLTGEEQAYPSNWEFSRQHNFVNVEVRPDNPYSVTTTTFLLDGDLHIPAMQGSTKQWPQYVLVDSRVRIKIDDVIYPANATLVSQDAGNLVLGAATEKFLAAGRQAPALEDLPEEIWLFKISARGSTAPHQSIQSAEEYGFLGNLWRSMFRIIGQ